MTTKLRIPISTKLITATLLLLTAAIGPLVYKSTGFFEKVSTARELETNLSSATAVASEVDNVMQSLLEKAKTLAFLSLRDEKSELGQAIDLLLAQDRDLLNVDIYQKKLGEFSLKQSFFNAEKLAELGTNELQIKNSRTWNPFPFDQMAQGQIIIKKISEPETQAHKKGSRTPLLGIGFPLARDELGQTNSVAIAYVAVSRLQKTFSRSTGDREIFLIDKTGGLLAHPDEKLLLGNTDFGVHPLFKKASSATAPRGQMRFESPRQKKFFHGAYARTALGPLVVAQIAEDRILEPSQLARRQAVIITGFVVSISFLLVFMLALSLVNPIERLASLTRLVSKGNFDISAREKIKSHDEVGDLASAFDEMVTGLKERDKVKNLFNKFHGSSVTEDLLKKDVSVGGTRKSVTVFFSDVRGFTAFSESRSPEQVVEMLNEYFAVMVGIINKNGGVVDKFIGDAIMAVWGAPNETPNDTQNALTACLEMRKALQTLNEKRIARGDSPILIGMGLHAGLAISGTIGSEERMEYTVIGDTVNMTSRIEASTKSFGTDLLVSETIAQTMAERFWLEKAGDVSAKGKSEPLALFKVLGEIVNGEKVPVRTNYSDYEAEKSDKIKVA